MRKDPEPPGRNVGSGKSTSHANLADGYRQLMLEAHHLEEEISLTMRLASLRPDDECQESIDRLKQISRGQVGAAIQGLRPMSARETARAPTGSPAELIEVSHPRQPGVMPG